MSQNESIESLAQELLEASSDEEYLSESEKDAFFESSLLRNELPKKKRKLNGYKKEKYRFDDLFEKD